MAAYINNFQQIQHILREQCATNRLCCFFAIDDRPSLLAAFDRLWVFRKWIDTLSAAAGVYTFVFVEEQSFPIEDHLTMMRAERPLRDKEVEYLNSLPKMDYVLNPTVQIAARFGILPNELPGLIFFQPSLDDSRWPEEILGPRPPSVGKACFVSIPEERLKSSSDQFEQFLATLYSELIAAFQHGDDPSNLDSFAVRIQQHLTQGCKARIATLDIEKPIIKLIESDFRAFPSQPYEPERLKKIYEPVPAEQRKLIKIFLSYAREDVDTVREFYERLSRVGFSPWMDKYDLRPGEKWSTRIDAAMRAADFIMVFLSQRSVRKRGYVQSELKKALRFSEEKLEDDIYLIPVKIDNCEIPESLRDIQWLTFGDNMAGWEQMFRAIVEGFQRKQ